MMVVAFGQQLEIEVVVFLHGIAVVADEIGRFFDVAERFQPIFADFQAHVGAHVEKALADEVGGLAHDGDAFLPGTAAPGGKGGFGGGNGIVWRLVRAPF